MKSNTKLTNKQLYSILIPCAIIIFATSLETMMKVKDINLYHNWLAALEQSGNAQSVQDQSFQAYLAANLIFFFFKVLIPISLSINAYLSNTRIKMSKLSGFVWVVLVLGGLAYNFIELSFYSVFYYINLAGYIALLVGILSFLAKPDESKL